MSYIPHKHNRQSIRIQGYDYSQAGLYYLTICCEQRAHLFGEVRRGKMILSPGGEIADACWRGIPDHFPIAVCHAYVIMPNHVHGIIEITSRPKDICASHQGDEVGHDVGAEDLLPLHHHAGNSTHHHAFQNMIPRSIASIVKGYKIGVTNWYRQKQPGMKVWQRNYYEHIIRDEAAYNNISQYILNNPINWMEDELYHP